jgi:hypothetical protein
MAARICFVIPALLATLSAAASTDAQTADRRPTLEVVIDNRSSAAGGQLGAARTRARFLFAEAGIRVSFLTPGQRNDVARAGLDRISLIVLGAREAERLIALDARTLGFAIPSAGRVYVHYDRVHELARSYNVQPGWFLGVVIAHELAHVLLPAGHSDSGVMVRVLSPAPTRPPAFRRDEAQQLRDRIGEHTTLAVR